MPTEYLVPKNARHDTTRHHQPKGASMAILTSFKVPGDPHELLTTGSETFGGRVRDIAVQHGRLAQVIVDEGDGLRFFHLWATENGMLRASDQLRSLAEVPGRGQQEWRQWDVVHHEIHATPTSA